MKDLEDAKLLLKFCNTRKKDENEVHDYLLYPCNGMCKDCGVIEIMDWIFPEIQDYEETFTFDEIEENYEALKEKIPIWRPAREVWPYWQKLNDHCELKFLEDESVRIRWWNKEKNLVGNMIFSMDMLDDVIEHHGVVGLDEIVEMSESQGYNITHDEMMEIYKIAKGVFEKEKEK